MTFGRMSVRPITRDMIHRWTEGLITDPGVRRDVRHYVTTSSSTPKNCLVEAAERLRLFAKPTRVIWNTDDRTVPRHHGQRLADMIPKAELIELADCSVLMALDQPRVLAAEIRSFANALSCEGSSATWDQAMAGSRLVLRERTFARVGRSSIQRDRTGDTGPLQAAGLIQASNQLRPRGNPRELRHHNFGTERPAQQRSTDRPGEHRHNTAVRRTMGSEINRLVDVDGRSRPDTGGTRTSAKGINMSTQSRQYAIHRIRARRYFAIYLVFYVALATYLVAEWARSDAPYFWPVWPLLGGGIGLAAQASHVFGWQLPITERRIQREINRSS